MRFPIRFQWFLPTAVLLVAAIALSAVASSWLAVRRATRDRSEQLDRIVSTFAGPSFPYTEQVLSRLRGLSGAEFAAATPDRKLVASTLELPAIPEAWWETTPGNDHDRVTVDGAGFRLRVIAPPTDIGGAWLFVLVPEATWSQYQWQAAWPPLAVGAATLLLLLVVSGWLSVKQSRRIQAVSQRLAEITAGDLEPLPAADLDDEIRDLTLSANSLARQLSELHAEIRRTERFRVLGQLASGLAHQLRNSVAGAKLAIQLHARRLGTPHESLETALRQLELVNRQICSLLALSRSEQRERIDVPLRELVEEVVLLTRPQAEHTKRRLTVELSAGSSPRVDRDDLQAALLNLITNALEAAPHGGEVIVRSYPSDQHWVVSVEDDGPGAPPELVQSLFEPFVSGKPEGIGIGLTMAKAAAERHQGELTYRRVKGRTLFTLTLPRDESPIEHGPPIENGASIGNGADEQGEPSTAPAPFDSQSVEAENREAN
ncbi:MAG: HAMP domain-containing histidine kinase [Planctomycetales bacterium]|nr:HAMP domain-containing histidine kinase [Planctomycetales bacterium]